MDTTNIAKKKIDMKRKALLLQKITSHLYRAGFCVLLSSLFVYSVQTTHAGNLKLLPQRLSDQHIQIDMTQLEQYEQRLQTINNQGTPLNNYHFCKAQHYLDWLHEEYSENDQTAVITSISNSLENLLSQLEARKKNIDTTTIIADTSVRLRDDLWQIADNSKAKTPAHCLPCEVARLEVQLVWAGHEQEELGWRHAAPYINAAERLAKAVRSANSNCFVKPKAVTKPAPKPKPTVSVKQALELAQRVHFGVNSAKINPASTRVLNQISDFLQQNPKILVTLIGHTDHRGSYEYNLALSKRRAAAVKNYLTAMGNRADRIAIQAMGKNAPVAATQTAEDMARNRRVELVFSRTDGIKIKAQDDDLQIESTEH